ncbi:hypothetical protein SAMN05660690_3566 [Geodermatophilus telluris]|uniref:Uncharacterized protein n=1 Tax=Geodermatophilus telluris TaxID=1190417 RepID=A0A1G6SEE0_9ACTN|nr:hypothetical protein [Geodermatophilus telluris]SDD15031.1 hypothetical protein SAMN05660690_3566 [Geodermatophilus telluris]
MSPTVATLDQLDHAIAVAYVALGAARSAWDRCPSAANARAVDEAEDWVDLLLDERLATQG